MPKPKLSITTESVPCYYKESVSQVEVMRIYRQLSNPKKVEILEDAMGYMQQFNGRTVEQCIALATRDFLGYEDYQLAE